MILEHSSGALFYDVREVSGTEPILYLHSALGSSEEMLPIAACFPERTAIFMDFPGHGKSVEPIEAMTTDCLSAAVARVLSHLGIPKVDIVGYSLGGYVALDLAAAAPELVRSVASHAMKFYWTPDGIENAVATFGKAKGQESAIRVTASVIIDFLRRQLSVGEIRNSGIRVFLSTGELDEFVTPVEVVRLTEEIGDTTASSMIFAGAGHSLRKLSMDAYEKAVREFWCSAEL